MSAPARRSAYNLLYAVVAIAGLGACGSVTRGELRATVEPTPDAAVRAELHAPAATRLVARANGVDVVGRIAVASTCDHIATSVERLDNVVTLTVRREADREQAPGCRAIATSRTYTAAIRGLVPGEYLVRVVHDPATIAMQDPAPEQVAGR